MMHRVAITGGREVTPSALSLSLALAHLHILQAGGLLNPNFYLLHGGARGVDRVAGAYFQDQPGVEVEVYFPDYSGAPGGNRQIAPLLRNKRMVADADLLIAWPGGSGTADCVKHAKRKGIPIFYPEGEPIGSNSGASSDLQEAGR